MKTIMRSMMSVIDRVLIITMSCTAVSPAFSETLTDSWSPSLVPGAPILPFPDEWESDTKSGIHVKAHVSQFPFGRVVMDDGGIDEILAADGALLFDEESQSFFKVERAKKKWADAAAAAQRASLNGAPGKLATIRSVAQNLILAEFVDSIGKDVFIGGSDRVTDGNWRWYDGLSPVEQFWSGPNAGNGGVPVNGAYSNWKSDQPKSDKDVIKFKKNGEWESDDGNNDREYLVEWNGAAVAKSVFTGSHGFSNSAANNHRSLSLKFQWDTAPEFATSGIDHENDDKQHGTILFSFNEPVRDPVLHFERLGDSGNNESNSVQFKVLTPGVVLEELWESGPHLETTATTFRRRPNQMLNNPYPEVGPSTRGSVAGSIRFPGLYTSIELEWTGVGVEGSGSDEVEFVWDLTKAVQSDSLRKEALEKEMRPLSEVPVLLPRYIDKYIADLDAAKQLGKALFWDQQVGSDGMSCASCHFHAGADSRTRNQASPLPGNGVFDVLFSGNPSGPNHEFNKNVPDFPLHRKRDETKNDLGNNVQFDNDDSVTSSGVFHGQFIALRDALLGSESTVVEDNNYSQQDPNGFSFNQQGGFLNVRRVEPRNTPTTINAVFNFRNFWDGRANFFFNGVNPFGPRDTNAGIFRSDGSKIQVLLDNASLASQAVGPPLSNLEMSSRNKAFGILGRKMLGVRPLALQRVHPDDSLLKDLATPERGLNKSYQALIQQAFKQEWWNSDVRIDLGGDNFSQLEANFSFIWGVAIMLYEAELVSDEAPIDDFLKGDSTALTSDQKQGMKIFMNEGKCINCHSGANFTNATTRYVRNEMINRMLMGDNNKAIYDEGFYNIGVRRTAHDLGLGGVDDFGNPLSFSRQAVRGINVDRLPFERPDNFEIDPHRPPQIGERVAVDGAFKVPNLRNVELTGPFFHNGGQATLEQVVKFYARGGDFSDPNIHDLDPDIRSLSGIVGNNTKIGQVAAFLRALTDERVRNKSGIFDHPELFVFNGHPHDGEGFSKRSSNESNLAEDSILILEAVGRDGSPHPIKPFLDGIIPGNVSDDSLIVETGKSGIEAIKAAAGISEEPPGDLVNELSGIVATAVVSPGETVSVNRIFRCEFGVIN
jgi:cytochrome c peroxidase